MASIVELIRTQGRALGKRQRFVPAWAVLLWLKSKVSEDERLVVVFGNEALGCSASPVSTLAEFRLILRGSTSMTMTVDYYAIPKALIGQ